MIVNKEESLKKAILITAISKYSAIIINLAFSMILARVLTPEDYGIVAVVTVFTTFFSIFSDMGLGSAVIQNKELTKEDTNNIFSFSVYLGIVLCIVFAIFSYPMSLFYDDIVYFKMGCILAIALLFSTMNMIPNAYLMKEKLFLVAAFRTIVEVSIYGIITLFLAKLGFRYYSIAIASLIQYCVTYIWNMQTAKLNFHFRVDISSIKKVLRFSSFQFAFSIINYFSRNLDNLLTGKFIGKEMLGYYNKAYQLMMYPTSNLTHVITPVLHPILSDYQDNKDYIYMQYMKIVRLLACIGIFVSAFCYLGANEIISIFWGDKWGESIPCFRWLSISIWAQIVTSCTGAIFQSLNKTKEMFYCGSFNAILTVIAIIIGVKTKEIIVLSMCVGICYVFHFFSSYFVLIKFGFNKSVLEFYKGLWKEIFLAIVLLLAVIWYPLSFENMILNFSVKLLYLGIIYLIGLLLTGEYKMLLKLLFRRKG